MATLQEQIAAYENEMRSFQPNDMAALEHFRIRFLGAKGLVKVLFGEMKNVPADQRKDAGQLLNAFKQEAEAIWERYNVSFSLSGSDSEGADFSLPATPVPLGSRHPLRITENQIVSIFGKIGFSVATGPESEDDWHNFSSLTNGF